MHVSDALISPQVAGVTAVISCAALFVAVRQIKKNNDDKIIPIMGVTGAFIFAAQMINFSIPGTGSSGHIVGGILLSTLLGPWAALITLTSVLVIQCLVFADGGLMALGSNVLNMAVISCLIFYPFVYKPLIKYPASFVHIMLVSILACTLSLEAGAIFVVFETELSGITALPFDKFLLFMMPIHILIGVCEGIATGAAIYFVQKNRPQLLIGVREKSSKSDGLGLKITAVIFSLALLIGVLFNWIASSDPDGLEWSILKVTGGSEVANSSDKGALFDKIQQSTAVIPDYENYFSGIIGVVLVVIVVWVIATFLQRRNKSVTKENE